MKRISMVARRIAALVLAVVLLCTAAPAAFAEGETAHPTTMGGADTTLIPAEEENCLSWLFGSRNKITLPYLNIKGKGLRRNVSLDLVDCLVGITYTELGSIGSYVSARRRSRPGRRRLWPSTPICCTINSTALRPTP